MLTRLSDIGLDAFIREMKSRHQMREKSFVCNRHGAYTAMVDVKDPDAETPICPKCRILLERKKSFGRALRDFREAAHFPLEELVEENTFSSFEATEEKLRTFSIVRRFAENFPERLIQGPERSRPGLLILGRSGTGKSHMGSAICNCLKAYSPLFLSALTFFDCFRSRYVMDVNAVVRGFSKISVLVLDELGRSACTDYEQNTLLRVLDAREHAGLPTVFISNIGPKDIAPILGDGIASRIRGSIFPVVCDWEDYRVKLGRRMFLTEEFF